MRHTTVLFFFTVMQLHAQTDAGSLRVGVGDSSGASVAGATVKVTNEVTNVSALKKTDADGYATFDPIQRGAYDVVTEMTGFQSVKTTGVTVMAPRL